MKQRIRQGLASLAAGSAVTLGAGPARAEVVYSGPSSIELATDGATFDLDFDGDAVTDFQFQRYEYFFPFEEQNNGAAVSPGAHADLAADRLGLRGATHRAGAAARSR
jgi:hypothetical protein